jgi:hypothetical protein
MASWAPYPEPECCRTNLERHMQFDAGWHRQVFRDDLGRRFSVGLLNQYAINTEQLTISSLPVDVIAKAELKLLRINFLKLLLCDCDMPVILLMQHTGHLTVPDGRHRLIKARYFKRRKTINALVVPWTAVARQSCQISG